MMMLSLVVACKLILFSYTCGLITSPTGKLYSNIATSVIIIILYSDTNIATIKYFMQEFHQNMGGQI